MTDNSKQKPLSFFQALYNNAKHGWLSIWMMPDKKTAYFPVTDIPAAVKYAEALFETHDVYYGVGLRREQLGEFQNGAATRTWALSLRCGRTSTFKARHTKSKTCRLPPRTHLNS